MLKTGFEILKYFVLVDGLGFSCSLYWLIPIASNHMHSKQTNKCMCLETSSHT